jgi:transmembrane 9 superfamily protein 2/4
LDNLYFYKCFDCFAFFSLIFGVFFILNLVLWANGSSAAIPFTTFLALLALWFCVSTPLVFVGAYLGFKRPVRMVKIL